MYLSNISYCNFQVCCPETSEFVKLNFEKEGDFLNYLSNYCWDDVVCSDSPEHAFDKFYEIALNMLDSFYPMKSITMSNHDPGFVTPEIKSLLRRRNKLRRTNKMEEVNAISKQISKIIVRQNSKTFAKTPRGSKELWERVNKITGKAKASQGVGPGSINAENLNAYYASMSTDDQYDVPVCKLPEPRYFETFSEFEVFRQLDTLGATSSGLDGLPHWFLRIAAPSFSQAYFKVHPLVQPHTCLIRPT